MRSGGSSFAVPRMRPLLQVSQSISLRSIGSLFQCVANAATSSCRSRSRCVQEDHHSQRCEYGHFFRCRSRSQCVQEDRHSRASSKHLTPLSVLVQSMIWSLFCLFESIRLQAETSSSQLHSIRRPELNSPNTGPTVHRSTEEGNSAETLPKS